MWACSGLRSTPRVDDRGSPRADLTEPQERRGANRPRGRAPDLYSKDTHPMLASFWENFRHNLFKPLLLFFYMGFLVPILGVKLDFPHIIYQGLTIYLLISIGWHGGEELAHLPAAELGQAGGFMVL